MVIKTRDNDEYRGLSTDIKPTVNVDYGSVFLELDTRKIFTYDKNINPITSNGWWEV